MFIPTVNRIRNLFCGYQQKKKKNEAKRKQEKKKLQQAIEEARLYEQAKRNAARYQQECAELAAYEKHYGKVCNSKFNQRAMHYMTYLYQTNLGTPALQFNVWSYFINDIHLIKRSWAYSMKVQPLKAYMCSSHKMNATFLMSAVQFGHQLARWHRDSDRIHNRYDYTKSLLAYYTYCKQ